MDRKPQPGITLHFRKKAIDLVKYYTPPSGNITVSIFPEEILHKPCLRQLYALHTKDYLQKDIHHLITSEPNRATLHISNNIIDIPLPHPQSFLLIISGMPLSSLNNEVELMLLATLPIPSWFISLLWREGNEKQIPLIPPLRLGLEAYIETRAIGYEYLLQSEVNLNTTRLLTTRIRETYGFFAPTTLMELAFVSSVCRYVQKTGIPLPEEGYFTSLLSKPQHNTECQEDTDNKKNVIHLHLTKGNYIH